MEVVVRRGRGVVATSEVALMVVIVVETAMSRDGQECFGVCSIEAEIQCWR